VAGVMISASIIPIANNGIKVFGHSGYKLPDEEEHAIEEENFPAAQGRRGCGPRWSSSWTKGWTGAMWTKAVVRR